jgi:hypothetical protein
MTILNMLCYCKHNFGKRAKSMHVALKKKKKIHFLFTNPRGMSPWAFPKQLLYFISALTSAVPNLFVRCGGVCKITRVLHKKELAHPSSGLMGMKKS